MPILRPLGYIPTTNPEAGSVYVYVNAANNLATRDSTGLIKTYSTGVTPEEVQDIVGALIQASATISPNYDDVNNRLTLDLIEAYLTEALGDARYSLLSHIHALATQSTDGFMSAADKFKLDNSTMPLALKNTTFLVSSSNVVFTNIPSLTANVVAGKHYRGQILLPFSAAATTTGIAFALTKSASASGQLTGDVSAPVSSNTRQFRQLNAFDTAIIFTSSEITAQNLLKVEFNLICYSSGTITPQFRSEINGSQIQILGSGTLELVEI